MTDQPLQDRRILITRPRSQSATFVEKLQNLGADAVSVATVEIAALMKPAEIVESWQMWPGEKDSAFAVFTSANAVRLVADAFTEFDLAFAEIGGRASVAAVGSETVAALTARGVVTDVVPDDFTAEALAKLLEQRQAAIARAWLPQSQLANPHLAEALREQGAEVEVLKLYQPSMPADAPVRLRDVLQMPVDAVTFFSASAVDGFAQALEGDAFPISASVVCIGPTTAAACAAYRYPSPTVGNPHTEDGVLQALLDQFI